jgi:PAS domain S-box-containing protein
MPSFLNTVLNRPSARYIFAAATVSAACLIEQAMLAHISPELPTYLVFYPAVMLVGLLAGLWPGLLATGLAALLAAYWVLPPPGLAIGRPADALGLAVFAFMGASMSIVAELYRKARQKAAAYDREAALQDSREALRQSEQRLSAAAMAAEIGLWYWNAVTGEMIVNASWRGLFRIAPQSKVTLETWRNALHPQDRDRVVRTVMAALRKKRDYHCEYRVVWPDCSVHWIVDRGRPFYDDNGQLMSLAGINLDITERKGAEEAVVNSAKSAEVGNAE